MSSKLFRGQMRGEFLRDGFDSLSGPVRAMRSRNTARLRRSTDIVCEVVEKRILMAATPIAVWNFNGAGATGTTTLANLAIMQAVSRSVNPASMTNNFNASTSNTTIESITGSTVGADTPVSTGVTDPAGTALGPLPGASNVNNGKNVTASVSTANYSGIKLTFSLMGSSTGFNSDYVQYSTDGSTFTNYSGGATTVPASATLETYDFSSITALNNNPNAAFRIVFNGGTASNGTNRIDNFIVAGNSLAPAVTGVSPNQGQAGTTLVSITGTNFSGATMVTFSSSNSSSSVLAASFIGNTGSVITLYPPSTMPLNDVENVTVTNNYGTSATIGSSGQFTNVPAGSTAPTVSGLSIGSGPAIGGESVIITGTNLTGATNVSFGANAASTFNVTDSSHITVTEPAGTASTTPVDVVVTVGGVNSSTGTSDQFIYNAPTGSVAVAAANTGIDTARTVTDTVAAENSNYSISSVHFYVDVNKNGVVDAGDIDLGLGTQSSNTYGVSFTPSLASPNLSFGTYDILANSNSTSGATLLSKSANFTVASPQFQFSPLTYATNQSAASVVLTVTRTLDTTEAVQVNYNTVDGTAIAGTDYNATSGTLYFPSDPGAVGSTDSQTITIPLLDSASQAGVVSFKVHLSGAASSNASQGNLAITIASSGSDATVSSQQLTARAFTAGDVVVERIGDGTSYAAGSSAPIFIDEYSPAGAMVQSFPIQSTAGGASGTNQPLTANASSTTEGFLTVSEDGHYLLVPGYSATAGTASITSTSPSGSPPTYRGVGIIDPTGNINTKNSYIWTSAGNNPRTVTSVDGINLYLGDSTSSGVKFAPGNTATGQLNNSTGQAVITLDTSTTGPTSIRDVQIVNGQLYVTSASGGFRVATVGTGLPTTASQVGANLPGISNNSSGGTVIPTPSGFFLTSDNGGASPDTLYVGDDDTVANGGGIYKFSLESGTWVLNNIATAADVRGLTGIQGGAAGVTLFATTADSNFYVLHDTSGFSNSSNISFSSPIVAATNDTFRGVAVAPLAFSAPVITSLSATTGSYKGGTAVTIFGANFSGASVVMFGTHAAAVTYINSGQLNVIAPAGIGTVGVTVSTQGGLATATSQFTYTPPTWLSSDNVATYDPYSKVLTVTGSATIIGDPGTDAPIITGTSSAAQLGFNSSVTSVHIGGINLSGGATITLPAASVTPMILLDSGSLLIDAVSKLDLGNNYFDLASGDTATISSLITAGYNNGAWTGFGITSASAAANSTHATGLAFMINSSPNIATIDGVTLASTDALVKYTYYGDADLTGTVDGTDYSRIDNAALSPAPLTGWYNGDFNYDGVINGSDYTLIDNVYNTQAAQFATPAATVAHQAARPTFVSPSITATVSFFSTKKVKASLFAQLEELITG